jgi:predicted ATPase
MKTWPLLCRRGSALLHGAASSAVTPSEAYARRVESGVLTYDAAQRRVVAKFMDKLHRQLQAYHLPELRDEVGNESQSQGESDSAPPAPPVLVPRGLYVHGHVGTGKSMLMDLFFDHVQVQHKRRVHFNKFMLEVHQRLQRVKQEQLRLYGRQRNIVLDPRRDAISIVAEELVQETHVLCFDEFQVTDIADAMIMRKLFAVFFGRGGVMVATSNTAPQVRE